MAVVSTTKLFVVAFLGFIALFLATLVLTLQLLVIQKQQEGSSNDNNSNNNNNKNDNLKHVPAAGSEASLASNTILASLPTDPSSLNLWKQHRDRPLHGQRRREYNSASRVSSKDYWKPVQTHLSDWDATKQRPKRTAVSGTLTAALTAKAKAGTVNLKYALQQAAALGHADAQHYYAAALSSGVWPLGDQHSPVKDDLWTADQDTSLAYLHWHMAAIDGHIEASMALAYRLDHSNGCDAAIPYKEAAAHAIMDALEADIHSRAKITPPMDKHALPEIHTHGGTSSQLEWDNKPNESPEAMQYYHIRATAPSAPDLHAAYTLGHLYHYGLRGVDWNITKALQYYEIAANAGHWEAAGQAGKFHFWSLGVTERSLVKAHKYFSIGAPYDLEGCRTRYRNALNKKGKADESPVTVCDHPSLNGMGLLHLFGVPMVVPINVEKAKQFFILARDMGNMDASYNLAMLRLGWKHAWKDQDETGFTSLDVPEFMNAPLNSPNPADFGFAVQELANAANKGHLQARHRLAMLHHHGVTLPGHKTPTLPPDCAKAMVHYQWILDHAAIPWSQRTRMAYDQYMRGDLDASLRNYMLAAETGHAISQVNAAFLLERGTCLGLAPMECRKAALRWWKAAAQQGHAEAALRVGDFYYFGNSETLSWLRPVLFPEKIVVPMVMGWYDWIRTTLLGQAPVEPIYGGRPTTCSLDEDTDDPSCPNNMNVPNTTTKSDLAKAAQYYRMASERHNSPRAHFNLGYMHEWGLGLQQDFPLAKRHYDLARFSSKNQGEADFAVQLALLGMKIHENYDKAMVWWRDYQKRRIDGEPILKPVPLPRSTTMNIVIKHVLSWESLLIIVLTIVLSKVLQFRTVR